MSEKIDLEKYQIISQTALGVVGILGYMVILGIVISRVAPWTSFQENQVASALGFLAGTIVGGIYQYAFGSSFGSMAKNSLMQRPEQTPPTA